MEVALEAGADDVLTDDDGAIEVLSRQADFEAVKAALAGRRPRSPSSAEVTMRAENTGRRSRARTRSGCRSCSTCIEDLDDIAGASITTPRLATQ